MHIIDIYRKMRPKLQRNDTKILLNVLDLMRISLLKRALLDQAPQVAMMMTMQQVTTHTHTRMQVLVRSRVDQKVRNILTTLMMVCQTVTEHQKEVILEKTYRLMINRFS